MSFIADFFSIGEGFKETAVCCPFDHYTSNGIAYKETNPSAHVNTIEHLFHCKVCGTGYSELQFIQKVLGCSFANAKRIQHCFNNEEDVFMWNSSTKLLEGTKERIESLGVSPKICANNLIILVGSNSFKSTPAIVAR